MFINGLLIDLENSKLCCKISRIPSSPAGYADDLAAATVSKLHTDKVHNMVNDYGKSGGLILMLVNLLFWFSVRIGRQATSTVAIEYLDWVKKVLKKNKFMTM